MSQLSALNVNHNLLTWLGQMIVVGKAETFKLPT